MSLFGIFYPLFHLGVRGTNGIKSSYETQKNKEEAISYGNLTYLDSNFQTRLVSTDEKVWCGNVNGNQIIRGQDGRLIKNITLEEKLNSEYAKMAKKYAEVNNMSMYPIGSYYSGAKDQGLRYKDMESDTYYVACTVNPYKNREVLEAYKIVDSLMIASLTNNYKKRIKKYKGYNDFYCDYVVYKQNNNIDGYYFGHEEHGDFPFFDEDELKNWYNKSKKTDFKRNYENYKEDIKKKNADEK